MKLILIYGPPAVGKLTIANEIARRTRFKVFHNHLTVDLVESIFPRGTPSFGKLIWEIRLAVFAEAVQANVGGLIFTMVYGRNRENAISRCVSVVEQFGGEVCLVHLYCDTETLKKRVVDKGRKQHGKITSVEVLNEALRNLASHLPFEVAILGESLSIDTDVLSPVEAAEKVISHYHLQTEHHRCDIIA